MVTETLRLLHLERRHRPGKHAELLMVWPPPAEGLKASEKLDSFTCLVCLSSMCTSTYASRRPQNVGGGQVP